MLKVCNLMKKRLGQIFSREFYEIFENIRRISGKSSFCVYILLFRYRRSHHKCSECSMKKLFVKTSQYSQESKPVTLLKKDSNRGVFMWIFEIFKSFFLKNSYERLLLQISSVIFCKIYQLTTDFSIHKGIIFNYISWIQRYWKLKLYHSK